MGSYYSLTHPQKRILITEQIQPGTPLYNIGGTIRFKGAIDLKLLEEAIQIFIQKNEGLCLRVRIDKGDVSQYVTEYNPEKLDFYDFRYSDSPEDALQAWADQEAQKAIQLYDNALFYFALFRINEYDQGYFVRFHHLIADGWSINIMTGQIVETYLQLSQGIRVDSFAENSYLDYLELETKYLNSERFEKDRAFWMQKFRELPEVISGNRNSEAAPGKRRTFQVKDSDTGSIRAYLNQYKFSLNVFCTAVFLVYLYKTTKQADLVIGNPVLNRSGKKEKSMVGMFTSTMPFRFKIDAKMSFHFLIEQVDTELRECFYHQKYPYDLLVRDLELTQRGYTKLFDTCVNYYNTKLNTSLANIPIENLEFYNGYQLYALQWVIKDWSDSTNYTWDFDYQTGVYEDYQIEQMYHHLITIISRIIEDSTLKIAEIPMLSEAERRWVLDEFNATEINYPVYKTIVELFEEQVQRSPERIALIYREQYLTYQALNEKANQLAVILRKKGVGREVIVGLMVSHSVEMLIGIWGILKVGGTYLPIEPDYPVERISYMLKDAACSILLTNVPSSINIPFDGFRLDLEDSSLFAGESGNPEHVNQPDDLVYVIYTSGSTGKPKGVMVEHRGLVNYIWWARNSYLADTDEVFALYSSLAFDLTVTSIFTPLINGNPIIIYDNNDDEFVLYKIIRENRVNVIKLTPAHLALLKDRTYPNSSIKKFIVGGEDLKVKLAKAIHQCFNGEISIFNEYGPTETVVGCMIHRYDFEKDTGSSVPIGIPAANTQIYILDETLQPLPPGTLGEMFISGAGVARGYLNSPGISKERFLANPFREKQRMYRTGDQARHGSDGKIVYYGRNDHQIKLRGYRIELGEIEKHLLKTDGIKEAVVIDFQDTNGENFLCAYLVTETGLELTGLRQQLEHSLPEYMIPRRFITIEQMPLTSNGKINRKALPEPILHEDRLVSEPSYLNQTEEILCKVMGEILGIHHVGREDNFFQLGGDSIKAIQMAAKLNEYKLKIKVKDVLAHPLPGEMVAYLETVQNLPTDERPCEGDISLTPIVAWFWEQQFSKPDYYHQSVLLRLKPEVGVTDLERSLTHLIQHHDGLRLNYSPQTGRLFYNKTHLQYIGKIPIFDLATLDISDQLRKMAELGTEFKSAWDISRDLLFKACIFDLGGNGKRLLITAHHLIIDGVSWRIIIEDLNRLLQQSTDGSLPDLPHKSHSYQSWAAALNDYSTKITPEEVKYWQELNRNQFRFPVTSKLDQQSPINLVTVTSELTREETEMLLTTANSAYHTKPGELVIMALALVIKKHTAHPDVLFELEGHGREELFPEIDISRTVGWFTSIYPVKLQLIKANLTEQIKSLKEQLRQIPNHGIGFGVLRYLAGVSFDFNRLQPLIRFNYLGEIDHIIPNRFIEFSDEDSGPDRSPQNQPTCLFEINALIIAGKLRFTIHYLSEQFPVQTVERFSVDFLEQLQVLLRHCCTIEQTEFTPSDFETVNISQRELDQLFG